MRVEIIRDMFIEERLAFFEIIADQRNIGHITLYMAAPNVAGRRADDRAGARLSSLRTNAPASLCDPQLMMAEHHQIGGNFLRIGGDFGGGVEHHAAAGDDHRQYMHFGLAQAGQRCGAA